VGDWASGEIGVQSKESSCFFGKFKSCGVGKSDLDMLALIVAVADAPVQLGTCEGAPGDESSQMGARSGIAGRTNNWKCDKKAGITEGQASRSRCKK
jgi:hypothetical protein